MYPRTWRMRYEEEVRVLLEDNPPSWSDIAGLAGAVVRERLHTVADPVDHPVLAALIFDTGAWFTTGLVISVTARVATGLLTAAFGTVPEWYAIVGVISIVGISLRALLSTASAPLSTAESRLWWAALWLSVVLANWADDSIMQFEWGLPFWFACVLSLRMTSQTGWQRARARTDLHRLRRELREASAEHRRLVSFTMRGLAVQAEVDAASQTIARINGEVRDAARAYRLAGVRRSPPDRPLGL